MGERRALRLEYLGLIAVFTSYAFVDNATVAAGLYIVDHLFFALSIAINTYFQKIAEPRDIAATASVSFTINHIAAVFIPALLGLVWLTSPATVFLIGSGIAVASLLLCSLIPDDPQRGNETLLRTARGQPGQLTGPAHRHCRAWLKPCAAARENPALPSGTPCIRSMS